VVEEAAMSRTIVAILAVLCLPAIYPSPIPPPDRRTVERAGLRITLESIGQVDGQIEIAYSFTWIEKEPRFGFGRCWGQLTVLFWDAKGNELVEERYIEFLLHPEFYVFENARRHEGRGLLRPPPGARTAAIGFPRAKMITPRSALPLPE
jgi:hypothetical protein